MRKCLSRLRLAFAAMIIFSPASRVIAIPPPENYQYVTVQPTDPLATEPEGTSGIFTLSRVGNTNESLTVTFTLSGTATNGVNYATIPGEVTLAAGQLSSNIAVTPIAEPSATGYKTVV